MGAMASQITSLAIVYSPVFLELVVMADDKVNIVTILGFKWEY